MASQPSAVKAFALSCRIDEAREQVRRLEQHHAVLAGRHFAIAGAAGARRARRCAAASTAARKPTQPAGPSTPGGVIVEMPAISVMPRLSCTCRPNSRSKRAAELRRQRRGAGAAVADRRDVGAGQRHVGQRREHRRHRRERRSRGTSRPAASSWRAPRGCAAATASGSPSPCPPTAPPATPAARPRRGTADSR